MALMEIQIDNELLIQEVKARPALYDKNLKGYGNINHKKKLWEDVAGKIFSSAWHLMTMTQRENKVAEVLKRWNNLRTAFTRELKVLQDPLHSKRRRYIYFDKLLFLIEDNHNEHEYTYVSKTSENDFTFHEPSTSSKRIKETQKSGEKATKEQIKKYYQYSIEELRDDLAHKNRTEDNNVEESRTKSDVETNFALSLVSMLKMIPMDRKIDAHIDILNVIKKYKSTHVDDRCDYSEVKLETEDEIIQSDVDSDAGSLYKYGEQK